MERQKAAEAITRGIGAAWYGTEFWYVVTELNLQPEQTAATWSMETIYEAYFYLRLRHLRGIA